MKRRLTFEQRRQAKQAAKAMHAARVTAMQPLADELAATVRIGQRSPTAEELVEMRLYAARFRKRYPCASDERVEKAVAGRFGITIIPEQQ